MADPQRYATELHAETERLARATAEQYADAIVPTCPEWTVRDLVTHVGSGHRYAARVVTSGAEEPYARVEAPADWGDWLADGARQLTTAVERRGFDGPVWTWHPGHRTAGFWLRRMTHDVVVHRFDAEPDGDLAPDLAADGLADLLLTFAVFDKLTGDGETLQFTATDLGRGWHVTLTPQGIRWRDGEGPAGATLAAPARELLLVLNRRREPGEVLGDQQLFARWLDNSRF